MWPGLHESIASAAQPGYPLSQWPSSAAVWLPGGRVPAVGEIFRQPDLAATFQRLTDAEAHASGDRAARIMAARDLLYRGELAQQIVSFYQGEGSILTAQDLAEFAVKVEPPAHTTYRGYDVYSCGPWCQGPTLLQALNLLEGFDLPAMGRGTAAYLHTVAEALDLAFADRERYYGDPDLIDVPLAGLLSKDYAAARRELIREGRTWGEMPPAGDPWSYQNGHGSLRRCRLAAAPGLPRAGGRHGLRLRRGCGRQHLLGHALRRHLRHPDCPGAGLSPSPPAAPRRGSIPSTPRASSRGNGPA